MKMLTGLLPPRAGEARLFGQPVDASDLETRKRVGYMSQSFSLYGELTVRQNLDLHARLFHLPRGRVAAAHRRAASSASTWTSTCDALPESLPLGVRQRLSAGGGGDPRAGDADPRRADLGRRSRWRATASGSC